MECIYKVLLVCFGKRIVLYYRKFFVILFFLNVLGESKYTFGFLFFKLMMGRLGNVYKCWCWKEK